MLAKLGSGKLGRSAKQLLRRRPLTGPRGLFFDPAADGAPLLGAPDGGDAFSLTESKPDGPGATNAPCTFSARRFTSPGPCPPRPARQLFNRCRTALALQACRHASTLKWL